MTLSDLIVSYLEQFKVEYVFGIPGSPLIPLFDALSRSEKRNGPRLILSRHETGGAFMADGYSRETGKIGVCTATTGPGATNLITGVASAYADHVPMLAITPQTKLSDFGLGSFQESSADVTDVVGMFQHCTRYNTFVSHPAQLEKKLAAALTIANQHPKGPVHISIPIDIFGATADEKIAFPNLYNLLKKPSSLIDSTLFSELCQEVVNTLNKNCKIILLVGHDCKDAGIEITKFAELINASILSTQRGKSCINPYHPLYRGVFGFAGHKTARKELEDKSIDLVLAVGTNLSEWATSSWDKILLNNKLIHIQNTHAYFYRSPMARLHIYGTIKTILNELILYFEKSIKNKILYFKDSELKSYVPPMVEVQNPSACKGDNTFSLVKPQRIFAKIVQDCPPETRFLIDNSNSVPWSIHYFFNTKPENFYLSTGFASMGWAIGASIGIALGNKNIPVVCFTGDGCFLMNGSEITVAKAYNLPIIFAVLNDNSYGMIKHAHNMLGTEPVDFSIPQVDFSEIAKAIGINSFTIKDSKDFEKIDFKSLLKLNAPTLLDIHIDPDEKPPLGMF
ncbi:thiamine pyrophosphate-binding protein [Candidatus Desantisbacteria bacterium]|nr:thiamine pyrophosphate-binding protein [Candidatus Desantisbacteria bacterium]